MAIPPYQEGYPPDGSSLGQTKTTIRNNLDGTFETLAVDHINNNGQPGMQPPGYHTDIHMVPQGTWNSSTRMGAPAPIPGYGQLAALNWTPGYSGAPSDTQLFNITGGGGVSQLTGNESQTEGWAWMGGMLVQWGKVTSTSPAGSVIFSGGSARSALGINFPTAAFSITCTPFVNGSTTHASAIYVQNFSTVGFAWFQADRASTQQGFYWMAIGQ